MGLINLSSVFKSVGNIIKPLAQTAIKAIAPQAADMFKKILGDGFSLGKSALSNFMKALPLPSPLKSLAAKLLPKGMDLLQKLAEGGIDKLLAKIVGQPAPRTTADGVTVTPTPVTQPSRTDSIVNNTPGGTSSSSGAATGTGGTSGAGGTSGSSLAAGAGAGAGWSGGPPDPSKYDMTSPEGANKFQADMFKYQQAMNNIATFWQTMSNAFKAMSDTQKAIGSNLR